MSMEEMDYFYYKNNPEFRKKHRVATLLRIEEQVNRFGGEKFGPVLDLMRTEADANSILRTLIDIYRDTKYLVFYSPKFRNEILPYFIMAVSVLEDDSDLSELRYDLQLEINSILEWDLFRI